MNHRLNLLLGIIALIFTINFCFAGEYKNPIIPGFHPDPSICRVNDDYYLVTSSFEYFPGVPIFHSKDLMNWEKIGHCLTRESQLPLGNCKASGGIYAPTLRYHNGYFYMITTNFGGTGNFLVYTKDPAGEWSEPVQLAQKGIDPSLFWEGETCYFVSNPNDHIMLCEINPMTGEQLTESKNIWNGTGGRFPEAPHIYKKDNWYYLILSEGGTQYGHMVTIARSRNIYGPYDSNPANPILTHINNVTKRSPIQGVGHADFVKDAQGNWWLVALGFRPVVYRHHVMGRETFLAPISWPENSWPIVNGNGTIALEMQANTLPQSPVAKQPSKITFKEEKPSFEWNYLRNPIPSNYEWNSKKGQLTLTASPILLSDLASPTFVAQRQSAMNGVVTTAMQIPTATTTIDAGLTVFMNNIHHYTLSVHKTEGKLKLAVRYKLGLIEHVEKEIPLTSNKVYLRVQTTPEYYEFFYSTDNKNFTSLAKADTKYLSSETAGGFTGVYYGLYATTPMKDSKQKAVFDWFEYLK